MLSILCVVKSSICTAYPSIHAQHDCHHLHAETCFNLIFYMQHATTGTKICTQAIIMYTVLVWLCLYIKSGLLQPCYILLLGIAITVHTQLIKINFFLTCLTYDIMHRQHSLPLVNSFTSVLQGRRRSIHEITQIPGGNSASNISAGITVSMARAYTRKRQCFKQDNQMFWSFCSVNGNCWHFATQHGPSSTGSRY